MASITGQTYNSLQRANLSYTINSPRHRILRTRRPPFATEHDPEYFPFKVDGKDYFWLVSEEAHTYFDKMSDAAENCCTHK